MNGMIRVGDSGIRERILTIRGVQVMLDRDLAELYGVEVRAINQAVKRNPGRFPSRFVWKLTKEETNDLKSQTVISSWGGARKFPHAFTEQGVAMLSAVLHSPRAVETSVLIMEAFVAMRHALASLAPVMTRIESVERRQLKQDEAQGRNEARFEEIFDAMRDKSFPPQKVFFDGQFYDAFVQMKKFVQKAKKELVVIDSYFDDSALALLAQKKAGVKATVVRGPRAKLHAADVAKFNQQYGDTLVEKTTDEFHDRYLIIDRATLIHVGASLNHLGKRCFAFSTLEPRLIPDILAHI